MFATQQNQPTARAGSHALVIGGSIAGLLAARVLSDRFKRVTIVESDRAPTKPSWRKGTPQSPHAHILLMQGQRILEQLFPGLEAELAACGAPKVNWTADCPVLGMVGWGHRFPSDVVTRPCSRYLLEWAIRRRLAAMRNVNFLQECQVTSLLSNASKTRVTGVRVRYAGSEKAQASSDIPVPAQLVVDAGGRRSRAPEWLETLGYQPPEKTVVNSFLGYASRWFQRSPSFNSDWKALGISFKPPHHKRGGILYPVEGDRWIVTLSGFERDYPPTDAEGFLEFARSLRSPLIYEAIKDAEPISPIYSNRGTENRKLHYERLFRLPENFIVLGDAACAFNPVYAQGMTVAALGALTLDKCLKEQFQRHPNGDLTGLALHFPRQLAKVNAIPWMMATGEEFRWPTTQGGPPDLMTQLIHWYADRVMVLAIENPEVYEIWAKVVHMTEPPDTLFHPNILMPVLHRAIGLESMSGPRELQYPQLLAS